MAEGAMGVEFNPDSLLPNPLNEIIEGFPEIDALPISQIENWVGSRTGNYLALIRLLPVLGFFEGLYLKTAAKFQQIHIDDNEGKKSVKIHNSS